MRGTQRALLPLPLPSLSLVLKWIEVAFRLKGRCGRQQKTEAASAALVHVWFFLSALSVNYESSLHHRHEGRPVSRLSLAQAKAMELMVSPVLHFAKSGQEDFR